MPRRAAAWMLSLVVAMLVAAAPAHAALVPNEIDLKGKNEVLPVAVQTILDNGLNKLLFGITYEQRPDYVLVKTSNVSAVLNLLQPVLGLLAYAEQNRSFQLAAAPGDPLLNQDDFLGSLAADQAWNTTNGSSVTIGIVDSGVDLGHPDLAPNLLSSGTNLFARNGAPASDDQGHGTEVAGAAAARGGNGVGGAGIAWGSKIIPVKVTDATGSGTATDIADGIRYAVANGAKIINVSMAGNDSSQALNDAVNQAQAAGALLVVAAGNQGRNIDSQPAYPASYPQENVLAVGATGPDHRLASFSNSGNAVDIAAPGVGVLTSCKAGSPGCTAIAGGNFSKVDGTSIASPLVAGMAALLASVHPDWNGAQLRAALMAAAAACQPVAGVASGELCAPAEIRSTGAAGSAGAGAGGGSGGGGGSQGGGSGGSPNPGTNAGSASAKTRVSRVRPVRLGPGRTRLRWRLAGDRTKIRRVLVRVDKRKAKRLSRRATRLTVRGKAGRHRYTVTLLGAKGKVLARTRGTFQILR